MKKIYIFIFSGLAFTQLVQAQSLTKTINEPAVGDIHTITEYDSSAVIPRNTGSNQTWDFSSFTEISGSNTSNTFVAASSVPFASNFPGATLVEDEGSGEYLFYKSASTPTTQFELVGSGTSGSPSIAVNFTNSSIQYTWPMTYGNSFTDSFSGPATGFVAGTYNGNSTVTASGNGTITMPGGKSYSNILQIISVKKSTITITSPFPLSFTTTQTQYDYFEPTQKFPLLSVSVSFEDDGSSLDTTISVSVNKIITVGITDRNFDAEYVIYPNPAKDNFNVKLSNNSNELCLIEIYNLTGQSIKKYDFGSDQKIEGIVSTSDLSPGIYLVKTSLGERSSTRRLIIE